MELIEHIDHLVTMNDARQELKDVDIVVDNGVITDIGSGLKAKYPNITEISSARGCIVTPGLINTHHHLYQTLTRAVPPAQDALLFGWLKVLYPIWSKMDSSDVRVASQIGLAELAMSGCSLSSDHLYIYPNDVRLEDTIEAAESIGVRLHATRGAMSVGESMGGLAPDYLVECEPEILKDCIRVIDAYHDALDGAMVRIGVAPCSPFSVSQELMRDAALLARDKGVMLHTHLAENEEDIAYSQEVFGCRPGEYAERLGWVGDDVWHAHCVKLDAQEIDLFAKTGTGISHCPCSNCRLGSGIAPVRQMRDCGVNVGLGVDGSASNDGGNLIAEARQALLLQRVQNGASSFSAREALEMATRGGAKVLGRNDLGQISLGYRADLAVWSTEDLGLAGQWDPVAALVLCGVSQVQSLMVEGRWVIRDRHFEKCEIKDIIKLQNQKVKKLFTA